MSHQFLIMGVDLLKEEEFSQKFDFSSFNALCEQCILHPQVCNVLRRDDGAVPRFRL